MKLKKKIFYIAILPILLVALATVLFSLSLVRVAINEQEGISTDLIQNAFQASLAASLLEKNNALYILANSSKGLLLDKKDFNGQKNFLDFQKNYEYIEGLLFSTCARKKLVSYNGGFLDVKDDLSGSEVNLLEKYCSSKSNYGLFIVEGNGKQLGLYSKNKLRSIDGKSHDTIVFMVLSLDSLKYFLSEWRSDLKNNFENVRGKWKLDLFYDDAILVTSTKNAELNEEDVRVSTVNVKEIPGVKAQVSFMSDLTQEIWIKVLICILFKII